MDQSEKLLQQEEAELGLLRPSGPDAMLFWQAKHPSSCPECGKPIHGGACLDTYEDGYRDGREDAQLGLPSLAMTDDYGVGYQNGYEEELCKI